MNGLFWEINFFQELSVMADPLFAIFVQFFLSLYQENRLYVWLFFDLMRQVPFYSTIRVEESMPEIQGIWLVSYKILLICTPFRSTLDFQTT